MPKLDPSKLSVEEKIGQLFFIGIPGPDLDSAATMLLDRIRPGGVCLFARNIKSAEQTRALLDGIRDSLATTPFLSLDQEGGRVDRLRRVLEPMPAANQLRSAEDAAKFGAIIGEAISILGFNMDFAPVVDVITESRSGFVNGLQTRGFGKSREEVVDFAISFQDALAAHGILGCLKHFPGLAASTVDSHEELPSVLLGRDEIREVDLYPYRELLYRDDLAVMVAHAVYPNAHLQDAGSDGKLLPSSLDPRIVTSLLRGELNFKGVAVTDDMEMGAIVRHYGIGEASKMAVKAGEDMIAICASMEAIDEAYTAVTKAVSSGEIMEEMIDRSVQRIFQLKTKIAEPPAFEVSRLETIKERIKNLNQHLN